ncbi:hypothetical protein NIES3585_36130 [Nodularia sp. NIES-3585]|nr:hypothetical protein NIES3585_36130 [Nodularia sp. NIES-3585]
MFESFSHFHDQLAIITENELSISYVDTVFNIVTTYELATTVQLHPDLASIKITKVT